MSREIIENGKRYVFDENNIVVEASDVENTDAETTEEVRPVSLGDRVEVEGRLGKVVSRLPDEYASVYGLAVGVSFDDGDFGEYLEEHVSHSDEDAITYDKPLDQVKADWDSYQGMPEYTLEEVEAKARVARSLNVTSKALVTDQRTAFSDKVDLDHIILATANDLFDLKDRAERLEVSTSDYLDKQPKYRLPAQIIQETSRSSEDASWLLESADEAVEELGNLDWDAHLQSEALKATSRLEPEQLENEGFMEAVAEYREATMPLGFNDEKRAQFRAALELARKSALEERAVQHVAKTAAAAEGLENFDPAQLYL